MLQGERYDSPGLILLWDPSMCAAPVASALRLVALLVVVLVAACGWAITVRAADPRTPPPSCVSADADIRRTVARVIDGETLGLDDGTEVRLIGALAPRATDAGAEPGGWPLQMTAHEELRALLLGKSIEVAFGGERVDRHGRWQAHVFWMDGAQRRWLQGHLLEQGLARAYTLSTNRACRDELLAAEAIARGVGRGLWAEAAYQVRRPDPPSDLSRYHATFQIVEGRIARVGQSRGFVYLDFGRGRKAFSISLKLSDRNVLAAYAANPKGLEGQTVRVRGWIEQRGRPIIDISSAGDIEVLPGDNEAGSLPQRVRPRERYRVPVSPRLQLAPAVEAKPPSLIEAGR
ncbi:MAG: thermonuclease family protein [Hyphomicrobiaceae bacterium]|nr:MAG: thermonuclease family protein [Hyphomicrobiaceae bacterium]